MFDMMERIATAEQEADNIRQQAIADAKEAIAAAAADAQSRYQSADEEQRELTWQAKQEALARGEQLICDLAEQNRAKTAALIAQAQTRVEGAVEYLIERVEEF